MHTSHLQQPHHSCTATVLAVHGGCRQRLVSGQKRGSQRGGDVGGAQRRRCCLAAATLPGCRCCCYSLSGRISGLRLLAVTCTPLQQPIHQVHRQVLLGKGGDVVTQGAVSVQRTKQRLGGLRAGQWQWQGGLVGGGTSGGRLDGWRAGGGRSRQVRLPGVLRMASACA